jgi:hypothetical protein
LLYKTNFEHDDDHDQLLALTAMNAQQLEREIGLINDVLENLGETMVEIGY